MSQSQAAVGPDWSNFEGRNSCMFYKLMVASILQDKKLKIPEKFVKKYGDDLSTFATFTVPSSRIWLVELEKADGKMWFHNGWHEFVEFYSIRAGFFLVFRYEGKSKFDVHIFDLTVSEIKYPCDTLNSLQETSSQCLAAHKKDVEDGDIKEVLVSGPTLPVPISSRSMIYYECVNCNRNISAKHGAFVETLHQGDDACNFGGKFLSFENIGIKFNKSEVNEIGSVISGEAEGRTRQRKQRSETSKILEVKSRAEIISETFTRRWRAVTVEEKQKTVHAAEMFQPNNPYFKHIPSLFARKHLHKCAGFIKLQVSDGKQWSVRCCYKNGAAKLSKGWTEFVWENNLEEGDVCVFELINSKDILLKVTIFRVLEDATPIDQVVKMEPGLN